MLATATIAHNRYGFPHFLCRDVFEWGVGGWGGVTEGVKQGGITGELFAVDLICAHKLNP